MIIILIISLILSYLIGYSILRFMGIAIVNTFTSLLLKPLLIGLMLLVFGICVLGWLFKSIIIILGSFISLIISCIPFIIIIGLIVLLIKAFIKR